MDRQLGRGIRESCSGATRVSFAQPPCPLEEPAHARGPRVRPPPDVPLQSPAWARVDSNSIPSSAGSIDNAVLLPDRYFRDGGRLPLALMLHGAAGDREHLARFKPQIRKMWAANELPEMDVATPSAGTGSINLDSYDGKEPWKTFVMNEFLPHLRAEYRVSSDRKTTMEMGISIGGFGSLRLGFKYPAIFGAVVALQPGAWRGLT